ncbi:hypothetical protein ACIQOV_21180, partial [Kitasatospora sp. NPDC091257]
AQGGGRRRLQPQPQHLRGRTDLPGGDSAAIMNSLARVCLPLDDSTVVLSGHGGQTTIGRERATNPYLRQAAGAAGAPAFPRRGM